jgi:hypothetical protein
MGIGYRGSGPGRKENEDRKRKKIPLVPFFAKGEGRGNLKQPL